MVSLMWVSALLRLSVLPLSGYLYRPPIPPFFSLSLPTLPPPGAAPLLQDVCLPPPLAHLPRLSALRLDSAFHSAVAVLSGRVEHACPGSGEAGNASLPSSGGAEAGNASLPSSGSRPEEGARQVDSLDEALAIAGFRRGGRSGMVSRVRGRHTTLLCMVSRVRGRHMALLCMVSRVRGRHTALLCVASRVRLYRIQGSPIKACI